MDEKDFLKKDNNLIIITSITPIKNKKYEVILSDGEALELNEDMMVEYRIYKGKELTLDLAAEIEERIQFFDAYSKALSYATTYFKCSKEISDYLLKKGYSKDISDEVSNALLEKKVIDDDNYLSIYVSKLTKDGNGRLMISHKIYEKGLKNDYTIDEELYFDVLSKLTKKKLKTIKDKKKERLYRYLSSKGYTLEDINKALKGVSIE